ncbi:MAG: hypothetical protein M1830_007906 [Pleopsidium flavum]|nr:MAG: hypothetical protein M1830_007906 [Pleopsidium flavum]
MAQSQFSFLEIILQDLPSGDSAVKGDLNTLLDQLSDGDFYAVLTHSTARLLLGHEDDSRTENIPLRDCEEDYNRYISRRLRALLSSKSYLPQKHDSLRKRFELLIIGIAALHAFLQSNVTGPPLSFDVEKLIYREPLLAEQGKIRALQRQLLQTLTVDGEAAYSLTPKVELFCIAKNVLCHPSVVDGGDDVRWARMRVNFWHQRMLSENAAELQESIFQDLEVLEETVLTKGGRYGQDARVQFLLERAAIHTHHGFDVKARDDLEKAARGTGFEFALTGRLGKRTKFQEKDISQLVVLAKSADEEINDGQPIEETGVNGINGASGKPQNLDLNDDTLLESISFSKEAVSTSTTIQGEGSLSPRLASLDPSNQPLLKPLDSVILLSIASCITNTSPQHGLTREETLPYATRVLEGGSTNWQMYTQALLVRSRIEGYRSRTIERGVLQLQALVDQVIAETTSTVLSPRTDQNGDTSATSTFLPLPKPSESAPISERLEYIHQLCSPTRWELEAELAARWVSLGGLRTALEIYERLQMWAEAALCWAATEREDKARKIVRRQLFYSSKGPEAADQTLTEDDEEDWQGPERNPLPVDAPRLFCILGDIDKDPSRYERGWEVSKQRYARAQRSLGRYYYSAKEYRKADDAYAKSLRINQLNHPTWFALGCVRLELEDWKGAVDAFSRTVQLDGQDAETWSNLAAALLRLPPTSTSTPSGPETDDDESEASPTPQTNNSDPQRHRLDALVALKRAASLSHNSFRIWSNLLTVATSLHPPPYTDIVIAQKRLIELRGKIEGEACVDADVLEGLVGRVMALDQDNGVHKEGDERGKRKGLERMVNELLEKDILPLITGSRRLWRIMAKWELWRNKPTRALEANEKAWRAVLSQPGWEVEGQKRWGEVVDATTELVDAYESLGERKRTEGLGAGEKGAVVCPGWRFKARSAIRGVMGRAKASYEGSEGWETLKQRLQELKGGA